MAPIFPGRSASENTYTTVCVSHLAIRSLKSLPASQGFANEKGCSSQNQIHTPCMMYQSMQVSSLDRTSNIPCPSHIWPPAARELFCAEIIIHVPQTRSC